MAAAQTFGLGTAAAGRSLTQLSPSSVAAGMVLPPSWGFTEHRAELSLLPAWDEDKWAVEVEETIQKLYWWMETSWAGICHPGGLLLALPQVLLLCPFR